MTSALDVFCHWAPPSYAKAVRKAAPRLPHMMERALAMPVMADLDERFRLMDQFPGYRQAPCLISPPPEVFVETDQVMELVRMANDGMAAMAAAHPDRFPGFFASLPLNASDLMLEEARRAVVELKACGVQLFTSVNGAPIDTPPFMDLYELMAELDRPILLHPWLGWEQPDYAGEPYSKYELWWTLGWPYETSKAMYRLVFSGVFDRWPNLKIIAHHGGGLVPMVEGRIRSGLAAYGTRTPPELREKEQTPLRGSPLAAFKQFYGDTATFGSSAAFRCALEFFGPQRMLFATDMPFGSNNGAELIRRTLDLVAEAELTKEHREDVLFQNAERLMALHPVAAGHRRAS